MADFSHDNSFLISALIELYNYTVIRWRLIISSGNAIYLNFTYRSYIVAAVRKWHKKLSETVKPSHRAIITLELRREIS